MKKNLITAAEKIIRLLLRILPSLFWLLLIFGFDLPHIAVSTVISALIHESAHVFATCKITGRFKLKSAISGLRLNTGQQISYKQEIIVALAGPLSNLAVFIISFLLFPRSRYTLIFGILNLFTALSNLMPIEGYDGYRILECIILHYGNDGALLKWLQRISFTFVTLFSLLALYLMKSLDGGYWIYFIFIAVLIRTLKADERVFDS